jgi:acylphosphatase
MKTYHLIFKGRVQGVGFRYTSKMIADRLKLVGSVKNLYNGDVEVYVKGEEVNIEKFIEEINNQRFIRIDSIDKVEVDKSIDCLSFNIVH